jgi:hypothetical protein
MSSAHPPTKPRLPARPNHKHLMFYLECQCRFRYTWSEVEGVPPYADLNQAIWAARQIMQQRRTAVRIVDDVGNLVWQ